MTENIKLFISIHQEQGHHLKRKKKLLNKTIQTRTI